MSRNHRSYCLSIMLIFMSSFCRAEKPVHEIEVAKAWEAFNKKNYKTAVKHARNCILEFRSAAKRLQAKIEEDGEKPATGKPKDDKCREAIFRNGPLNDVSTAYFVMGFALEKMGERADAYKAYVSAASLTHGRTWDPVKEVFWSPAEAALERLIDPALSTKSPHEKFTLSAWDAFEKSDYRKAIVHSERCIKEFEVVAVEMQARLTRMKVRFPTGAVPDQVSDDMKKKIFANGLLNDVATCMFIRADSLRRLGNEAAARKAFVDVKKFGLARCWDPRGWFWSPAEAARDRLDATD